VFTVDSRVRIGQVAEALGFSISKVREMANDGVIPSERTPGGHRVFDLDAVDAALDPLGSPCLDIAVPLAGSAEHEVWRRVAGRLDLEPSLPSVHVIEYAFGEMLNNAIDHSGGSKADVRFWVTDRALAFEVVDDGIGAFERLKSELGLPDHLSAIQELSKGKRTTAPARHSGQGIFFTSKAVDRFELDANGWRWVVDNTVADQTVESSHARQGTKVRCVIDLASTRTMAGVFADFTHDLEFDRSRPSVKLLTYGTRLVSRSEAKLLAEGLDRFAEIDVDFSGVEAVGQGFVDEFFRVWAMSHPGTALRPVNMNPAVRFMVERGLPGASNDRSG
jgi:excisionase family DNA binding protein